MYGILPSFTIQINQMWGNIPYMDLMGIEKIHQTDAFFFLNPPTSNLHPMEPRRYGMRVPKAKGPVLSSREPRESVTPRRENGEKQRLMFWKKLCRRYCCTYKLREFIIEINDKPIIEKEVNWEGYCYLPSLYSQAFCTYFLWMEPDINTGAFKPKSSSWEALLHAPPTTC